MGVRNGEDCFSTLAGCDLECRFLGSAAHQCRLRFSHMSSARIRACLFPRFAPHRPQSRKASGSLPLTRARYVRAALPGQAGYSRSVQPWSREKESSVHSLCALDSSRDTNGGESWLSQAARKVEETGNKEKTWGFREEEKRKHTPSSTVGAACNLGTIGESPLSYKNGHGTRTESRRRDGR